MEPLILEPQTLTPEQYLQTERDAIRELTGKHELVNGQLITMSGATEIHTTLDLFKRYTLKNLRQRYAGI